MFRWTQSGYRAEKPTEMCPLRAAFPMNYANENLPSTTTPPPLSRPPSRKWCRLAGPKDDHMRDLEPNWYSPKRGVQATSKIATPPSGEKNPSKPSSWMALRSLLLAKTGTSWWQCLPPSHTPGARAHTVKTDDSPFCPPDCDEKPCDSPAVCKGHRALIMDLNEIIYCGIDTCGYRNITAVNYRKNPYPWETGTVSRVTDDKPIAPIRYTPEPDTAHTPALDAAPPSPTPSATTTVDLPLDDFEDEDMDINNDTMNNAHPAQAQAAALAAQQPVAPGPALRLAGAALVAAVVGTNIVLPTKVALLAFVPIGPLNDHQGFQPVQPAPTNLQNGRAPYAKARGQIPNAVTTCTRIFSNVNPEQEGTVLYDANEYFTLVMFLGGQRFFAVYQNVLDDIHKATASIASPAEMELYPANPAIAQTGDWSKKYQDPFVIFARFPDPAIHTKMHNQHTFAISHDLAFRTKTIDPARCSHTMGVWAPVKSSRSPTELQASARTAITLHILTTPTAVRDIAQMTQGSSNLSEYERALNCCRALLDQPPPAAGNAPAASKWWGPPDQMSKLMEGILSKNPAGGHGDDSPASSTSNCGGNCNGGRNNNAGGSWRNNNNGGRRN
ncbi:hypothetical protein B0H13DRAFT_1903150 [Mycena leptocephala]|nr:hypothetical protein B0H13DRAFT_1903150 [Mycena leptocephala]